MGSSIGKENKKIVDISWILKDKRTLLQMFYKFDKHVWRKHNIYMIFTTIIK